MIRQFAAKALFSALTILLVASAGCSSEPSADELKVDQAIASLAPSISYSSPRSYQVFQMDNNRRGAIVISGGYKGDVTAVSAKATVMPGGSGKSTQWIVIDAKPQDGKYSGKLPVEAGGWYKVDIKTIDKDRTEHSVTIEKVGVGLVFITSGQSNSVCSGSKPMQADDRVSTFDASRWRQGSDSQLGFTSDLRQGGSCWPTMATELSKKYDVPVAVTLTGYGGQAVRLWQAEGDHYNAIKAALEYLGPKGCAAVLWHQGESDSIEATPAKRYAELLGKVISDSRKDAGYDVPWVIAQASYIGILDGQPGEMDKRNAVLEGQKMVCDGKLTFIGPTTDDLTGSKWRREDKAHFNVRGLAMHGQRWADSLVEVFGKLHPKWAKK